MLISKRSLVSMNSRLDFQHSCLEIDNDLIIYLENLPSGHISIPALPFIGEHSTQRNGGEIPSLGTYPVAMPKTLTPIADAQILKIHRHLAHFSEYTMANLLRSAGRVVDTAQIRKVIRHCVCKGAVGRVTPPKITS